jgi:hypothetical protein
MSKRKGEVKREFQRKTIKIDDRKGKRGFARIGITEQRKIDQGGVGDGGWRID